MSERSNVTPVKASGLDPALAGRIVNATLGMASGAALGSAIVLGTAALSGATPNLLSVMAMPVAAAAVGAVAGWLWHDRPRGRPSALGHR
jgi:hypothetical protein